MGDEKKVDQNNPYWPPADPFKWLILILFFFVGLLFYFSSFQNGFIWDDQMVITPNLYIRDWVHIKEIFSTDIHHFGLDKSNFYRPLQAVSYMLDYSVWQLNPMGYHLSSVLIHIINSFLIYLIVFGSMGVIDRKVAEHSRVIAIACSLIWLVHPIHTQVVTYAAGRADELAALFILLSIYTFMVCKTVYPSLVFFMFSLCSKEYGVITPAFIFLFNYFGLSKNTSSSLRKFLPYGIVLFIYVLLRLTWLNFPTDFSADGIPGFYQRILTSAMAIVNLVYLLFVPFDLSMDRNIAWQKTIFNLTSFVPVAALMITAAMAFRIRQKFPVILFGIIWFCIGYAPVFNIIPLNANISEHWMYVPSIGIWLIFFYLMIKIFKNYDIKLYYGLIFLLVIYFGSILINRNKYFKDEIVFYNQILSREYKNPRVHYNLGCAYFYVGQEDEAYKHLSEAIKFKPDYAAAYGNLGQLEYRRGNVDAAIDLYVKANELKADLIENRVNLATAFIQKKLFKEAMEQLNLALKINPKHVSTLNNMGVVSASLGDYNAAQKYFDYALTIDPTDVSAKNNQSRLLELQNKKTK